MRDTYVFSKKKIVECYPDNFTKEELESHLIEQALTAGYIPKIYAYRKLKNFFGNRDKDVVYAMCAFAGKKQARIIYEANKKIINQKIDTIHLCQTS